MYGIDWLTFVNSVPGSASTLDPKKFGTLAEKIGVKEGKEIRIRGTQIG